MHCFPLIRLGDAGEWFLFHPATTQHITILFLSFSERGKGLNSSGADRKWKQLADKGDEYT
jgi:hypothetical protein